MVKSEETIIAGAAFSGQQMRFAGSVRFDKGDRVRIDEKFSGPAELRGKCGEIIKHRGLGKFLIKLDNNEGTASVEGIFLAKILGETPVVAERK